MTTETQDWMTMPAGRALDALVAERVMGWTGTRMQSNGYAFGRPPGWTPAQIFESEIPAYSTDIAEAWLVVVAMETQPVVTRVEVTCGTLVDGRGKVWSLSDVRMVDGVLHTHRGTADTAPLAICRAALQACAP